DAKERPIRPFDMLSRTAQSSATRIGFRRGRTTLPALSFNRFVIAASAAVGSAGFGKWPPNGWKCRSGTQSARRRLSSMARAASRSRRYFAGPRSGPSTPQKLRLNSIADLPCNESGDRRLGSADDPLEQRSVLEEQAFTGG